MAVRTLLSLLFLFPLLVQAGPQVSITRAASPRTYDPPALRRHQAYKWHTNITATIFWIGETPTARNPTPNHKSSWDQNWQANYGGFDNPARNARDRFFTPKAFTPKLNPFYIALPYNDVLNHKRHKPEASRVIPWFRKSFRKAGRSVCKGRWLQIYNGKKSCFAQWEDCGPFFTDDYAYVFQHARPKNQLNKKAGIDISPAVRDFLELKSGNEVHWRFVEASQVPAGPWTRFGPRRR